MKQQQRVDKVHVCDCTYRTEHFRFFPYAQNHRVLLGVHGWLADWIKIERPLNKHKPGKTHVCRMYFDSKKIRPAKRFFFVACDVMMCIALT